MQMLQIIKTVLDIIFPRQCYGCGSEEDWLCSSCLADIPLHEKVTCPICFPGTQGMLCHTCRKTIALDGLLVAAHYDHPLVQISVRALKYHYLTEISSALGKLLVNRLNAIDKSGMTTILDNYHDTILTVVPLHPRRQRERGFNQADRLAREIIKIRPYRYLPKLLRRTRYTSAQAKLNRSQRLKNMNGAFALNKIFDISKKNVIIIDDVATTLTTLVECAALLKRSTQCRSVWGLVIARGK